MSFLSTIDRTGPVVLGSLPFAIPTVFPFQTGVDLVALNIGPVSAPLDPAETLFLGSDYTVSGGGYNSANEMQSGNVTFLASGTHSLAKGDRVIIMRGATVNQPSSFVTTGPLTVLLLEQAIDRVATIEQQLNEELGRALQFENFESLSGVLIKAERAGKILAFDSNGVPTFLSILPSSGTSLTQVATVSLLAALDVTAIADGQQVSVAGYSSNQDGGAGIFVYGKASAETANGGTIIQPAAGPGRWLRVVDDYISPIWFGAGLGSGDDTTKMQAAMDAAAGKILLLEKGSSNYTVSDYINGVSNVRVVGAGGTIQNIDADGSDDISIFLFTGKSNFSVKGGIFVGSNKNINVVPMRGTGVACNGCSNFVIEDNTFTYFTRSGIGMENCTAGKVIHNHISLGNANLTTYDIETYTETGETNFDILIDGNTCSGSNTFGISVTNHGDGETKFTRVINNQISSKARHGIFCYAGTTYTPVDIVVRGNTVDDVGWIGIYVVGGGLKYVIDGNIIIDACNNVTSGLPWAAIGIGGTTGTALNVNNNVIQGTNGYPGIRIDNGNSFNVGSNIIWGDGTALVGGTFGSAAISLNDCADGNVVGNVVKYTGAEGAGVALVSTTTTVWKRISIDDNKIFNPSTFGVYAKYSGFASIEGNVVDTAVLFGVYLDHSTGATVNGNTIDNTTAPGEDIFISGTCTLCSVEDNKLSGAKATGKGIDVDTGATDTIVQNNDLVGLTVISNADKLINNGTRTQLKNNKFAAVAMNGTFTCSANKDSTIANANIVAASKVRITPTNAVAAALMAGVQSLYLNGLSSGVSFTFTTADASAAAGTETFNYTIE